MPRQSFRHGQHATLIAVFGTCWLQMNGRRVVDVRVYTLLLQHRTEVIALRYLHHVVTVDMFCPWSNNWHSFKDILQLLPIYLRMCPACGIPLVQVAQFHPQNSSLQLIQAGIDPHNLMLVAYARTMVTNHPHLLCKCTIIGHRDTGLAIGAHVFTVIQAKTANVSQAAHLSSSVGSSMGLRCILDHP